MSPVSLANASVPPPDKKPLLRMERILPLLLITVIIVAAVWFLMSRSGDSAENPAEVTVTVPVPAVPEAGNTSGTGEIKPAALPETEPAAISGTGEIRSAAEAAASAAETVSGAETAVKDGAPKVAAAVDVESLPEQAAEPAVAPNEELGAELSEISMLISRRRYAEAHEKAVEMLGNAEVASHPGFRREVIALLNSAADAIFTGRGTHPDAVVHTIASGDSLDRLARRHATTIEAIAGANRIKDPDKIMLGYDLKILPGPWSAEVDCGTYELKVFRNGGLFRIFTVGVGRDDLTPRGDFIIADRVVNPSWTVGNREIPFGDPENVVGTRWMPLRAVAPTPPVDGIAFHGCWDESGIGRSSSNGCIRLSNRDVEELYELLPINSKVTVR